MHTHTQLSLIFLSIANCGHPELLLEISNDSVPIIDSYDGLSIEGSTIIFSCPPGLELIGPNSAICLENGKWKPDPSGLMCKG